MKRKIAVIFLAFTLASTFMYGITRPYQVDALTTHDFELENWTEKDMGQLWKLKPEEKLCPFTIGKASGYRLFGISYNSSFVDDKGQHALKFDYRYQLNGDNGGFNNLLLNIDPDLYDKIDLEQSYIRSRETTDPNKSIKLSDTNKVNLHYGEHILDIKLESIIPSGITLTSPACFADIVLTLKSGVTIDSLNKDYIIQSRLYNPEKHEIWARAMDGKNEDVNTLKYISYTHITTLPMAGDPRLDNIEIKKTRNDKDIVWASATFALYDENKIKMYYGYTRDIWYSREANDSPHRLGFRQSFPADVFEKLFGGKSDADVIGHMYPRNAYFKLVGNPVEIKKGDFFIEDGTATLQMTVGNWPDDGLKSTTPNNDYKDWLAFFGGAMTINRVYTSIEYEIPFETLNKFDESSHFTPVDNRYIMSNDYGAYFYRYTIPANMRGNLMADKKIVLTFKNAKGNAIEGDKNTVVKFGGKNGVYINLADAKYGGTFNKNYTFSLPVNLKLGPDGANEITVIYFNPDDKFDDKDPNTVEINFQDNPSNMVTLTKDDTPSYESPTMKNAYHTSLINLSRYPYMVNPDELYDTDKQITGKTRDPYMHVLVGHFDEKNGDKPTFSHKTYSAPSNAGNTFSIPINDPNVPNTESNLVKDMKVSYTNIAYKGYFVPSPFTHQKVKARVNYYKGYDSNDLIESIDQPVNELFSDDSNYVPNKFVEVKSPVLDQREDSNGTKYAFDGWVLKSNDKKWVTASNELTNTLDLQAKWTTNVDTQFTVDSISYDPSTDTANVIINTDNVNDILDEKPETVVTAKLVDKEGNELKDASNNPITAEYIIDKTGKITPVDPTKTLSTKDLPVGQEIHVVLIDQGKTPTVTSDAYATKTSPTTTTIKPPTTPITVADPNKLTNEEKKAVEDAVKKENPNLPTDATITVDDDGAVTVKNNAGKVIGTLPSNTTVSKPTEIKPPTTPITVADPNKLTNEEKKAVEDAVKKENPYLPTDATITVDDDGAVTVTDNAGKVIGTLPSNTTVSKPTEIKPPTSIDIIGDLDNDGKISPTEKQNLAVEVGLSDDAKAGDKVLIDTNGDGKPDVVHQLTQNDIDDKKIKVNIPEEKLPISGPVTIDVTLQSKDGKATSPKVTNEATIQEASPAPSVHAPKEGDKVLSGEGQPGAQITITITSKDGNETKQTVTVGQNGHWELPYDFSATSKDTKVQVVQQSTPDALPSAPVSETVHDMPPASPTVNPIDDNAKYITGTAQPGATITVKNKDGRVIGTATVSDDGTYKVPVGNNTLAVDDKISVVASDTGGTSTSVNSTVRDLNPTTPTISNDTLYPTTQAITGKADPGVTVTLVDSNGNPILDKNGYKITAVSDSDGNYSLPISGLALLDPGKTLGIQADDGKGLSTSTSLIASKTVDAEPQQSQNIVSCDVVLDPLDQLDTAVTGKIVAKNSDGTTATIPANSTVNIKIGNDTYENVPVNPNDGTFSLPLDNSLNPNTEVIVTPPANSNGDPGTPYTTKVAKVEQPQPPTINPVNTTDTKITGKALPGTKVQVSYPDPDLNGNTITKTVDVDQNGDWSVDLYKKLTDQMSVVAVTIQDVNGQSVPSSKAETIVTQAQPAPTIDPVKDNDSVVTGTTNPNTEVTIYVDSNGPYYATADRNGKYAVSIPDGILSPGKTVTASIQNSTESQTTVVNPVLPPQVSPITAGNNSIELTTTTGAALTVTVNGNTVPVDPSDVKENPAGKYTVDLSHFYPDGLPDGATVEILAKKDINLPNGNYTITSEPTTVTVGPKPQITVPVVQAPTIDPVEKGDKVITGKAPAGSTVTIKNQDGKEIGTAIADGNGEFKATIDGGVPAGDIYATATKDGVTSQTAKVATQVKPLLPPVLNPVDNIDKVVSGKTKPNAEVRITVKDKDGNIKTTQTTTADDEGNFANKIDTIEAGDTITAVAIDNGVQSKPSQVSDEQMVTDRIVNQVGDITSATTSSDGKTATVEVTLDKDGQGNPIPNKLYIYDNNQKLIATIELKNDGPVEIDLGRYPGKKPLYIQLSDKFGNKSPADKLSIGKDDTPVTPAPDGGGTASGGNHERKDAGEESYRKQKEAELKRQQTITSEKKNDFTLIRPLEKEGVDRAYMYGYKDGAFRPYGSLTRAETASMICNLLELSKADKNLTTFSDVKDNWYNGAITAMVKSGIMTGYPDGTFKPNKPITKAEFTYTLAQLDKKPEHSAIAPFTDTKGHWAEDAINQEYANGRIGGYLDGTFKPNQHITRAEAATFVNNILSREVDGAGVSPVQQEIKRFSDVKPTDWFYYNVIEATNTNEFVRNEGIVKTYKDILNEGHEDK